jgi:hypothetical protein
MTSHAAMAAALRERLAPVEGLRKRARTVAASMLAGYLVLGLFSLAVLAVAVVGALWLVTHFVSDHPLVMLGATVAGFAGGLTLAILAFKAFSRLGDRAEAAYVSGYEQQAILPTLREALPGCTVTAEGNVDLATFDASGLFRTGADFFSARFGFAGVAGGVAYRASVVEARKAPSVHKDNHSKPIRYFVGVFVRLERPVNVPGTVRLVHAEAYQGGQYSAWGIQPPHGIVKAANGLAMLDAAGAVILDKGETTVPPVPPRIFETWAELRQRLGRPIFVSFNATGSYLAVATGTEKLPRLPLGESLGTNDPEELASEIELVQRVRQAVELLQQRL